MKEAWKKSREKPEVKARRKEQVKEYLQRPEVKIRKNEYGKEYHSRPENKIKRKNMSLTTHFKMKVKSRNDNLGFEILSTYSKRQSNSKIPCCVCCGLNEVMDFLALDHIAGKNKWIQSLN